MKTLHTSLTAIIFGVFVVLGFAQNKPTASKASVTVTAVPTTYTIGSTGTLTLSVNPSTALQPTSNIPVWSSSCTCVTVTPSANGMSATFKILSTAVVGQPVTIAATAPPYPSGSPGGGGQLNFTITASTDPVSYTITRTS